VFNGDISSEHFGCAGLAIGNGFAAEPTPDVQYSLTLEITSRFQILRHQ
jgi:hypothetical protein